MTVYALMAYDTTCVPQHPQAWVDTVISTANAPAPACAGSYGGVHVLGLQSSGPSSFTGLQLWVNGRVGVTNDGTGLCSTWADQSGNHRDFTQATPANRPAITTDINGKTSLTFSSSATKKMKNTAFWADICANPGTTSSVWTMYAVFLFSSQTGASANPSRPTIMADGTSGPNIGATCEVNGTGLDLSTFGFDVAYKSAIEASAGLLANPHYSTHLQNGTTLSAQLDATAPATLTVAAIALDTTPGHELVIGTNNQSTFSRFGGAIGEIIVYNYAVANGSAQDTAIKSFLKTQWGLP